MGGLTISYRDAILLVTVAIMGWSHEIE